MNHEKGAQNAEMNFADPGIARPSATVLPAPFTQVSSAINAIARQRRAITVDDAFPVLILSIRVVERESPLQNSEFDFVKLSPPSDHEIVISLEDLGQLRVGH